jgi:sortase A
MRNKRQVLRWSQYVLAAIGVVALGYWGAVFLNTRLYQARATRAFEGKLRTTKPESQPAPGSQPTTTARHEGPLEGSVVAQIAIPRLGIESIVVEGVEAQDLRRAPGHIPGTPLPGEAGNVAIAGHRDTFFRPLRLIREHDVIQLTTFRGEDQYRVVSAEIVAPNDTRVLYATGRDTLTLVTCYPFYYLGAAPDRFIVRAERFARRPFQNANSSE